MVQAVVTIVAIWIVTFIVITFLVVGLDWFQAARRRAQEHKKQERLEPRHWK